MNRNSRLVPTRFGPETRFEVPVPAVPFRVAQENELEKLKQRLLAERLEQTWETRLNSGIRRAANEAAALAALTQYPLLVFPELFEEKINTALLVAERQEQVWQRSRELLAV
ncbi:MAG TPA: hypothetical protein VN673_18130, partial [Clostridia bacterium]|nr:hypothetical protein [Clostridia bacterium]